MNNNIRKANLNDCDILAVLNKSLIMDEGHSNNMTIPELKNRMETFLTTKYQAWIYEIDLDLAGYCLFRKESDHYYIRQLYVKKNYRRNGIGRTFINKLIEDIFFNTELRIEVLSHNEIGINFWRSIGFNDYCITMKRKNIDVAQQVDAPEPATMVSPASQTPQRPAR